MANKRIYTDGGAVQANNEGIYVSRKADSELLDYCRMGEYVYVLCPRQVGKSSLMYRTANELKKEKILTAIIDLTEIGVKEKQEQWYLSILAEISKSLNLKIDFVGWWRENSFLGETKRLVRFFSDVVLKEINKRIVIFFDEIDTTLRLRFTDDFFAAIRSMYNSRATIPEFSKISFVFIGTATPTDFIKDPKRTPFNIGQRVDLTNFSFDEAMPLALGLTKSISRARQILEWVFEWTGGHPYLTQKTYKILSELKTPIDTIDDIVVSDVVKKAFLGVRDSNLQFVRSMLLLRAKDPRAVMRLYQQVLSGIDVPDTEQSISNSHLKLSGIVQVIDGYYEVSNKIYETVFNLEWVSKYMPQPKVIVLLALPLAAIPLLVLGYFVLLQPSFYLVFAVWTVICLLWTQRLRDVFSRIGVIILKPLIFYKDPEPISTPFYPRELMEDSAEGFRNGLTNPFGNFITSSITWARNIVSVYYKMGQIPRMMGYVFFLICFFVFVLTNLAYVTDTLGVSGLLGAKRNFLLTFDVLAFIGSILALLTSVIVSFESRAKTSQFSGWSDRDKNTKSSISKLAILSIVLSVLSILGWYGFRLEKVGALVNINQLASNLINLTYYGLIPLNIALATIITLSDALRAIVVLLIVLIWLFVGLLFLIDKIVSFIGIAAPVVADVLYRLVYVSLDLIQWFFTTPVRVLFSLFRFFYSRLFVALGNENTKA